MEEEIKTERFYGTYENLQKIYYLNERKQHLRKLKNKGENVLYFQLKQKYKNRKIDIYEGDTKETVSLKQYVESLKKELESI